MNTTTHLRALALTATAAVALPACGNSTSSAGSSKTSTPSSTTATAPVGSNEKEAATVNPRVLLSHDQGLTLLDAETGKTLKETKKPGFLRLSNAGDGRHVMVSDADVFRVFDMGISSQPHDDPKHNYTYEPGLAERTFAAPKAGHVVPHAGKVSLFSDGAGTIQTLFECWTNPTEGRCFTRFAARPTHRCRSDCDDFFPMLCGWSRAAIRSGVTPPVDAELCAFAALDGRGAIPPGRDTPTPVCTNIQRS
ncbi:MULTISPECIES: hypothetical protein [Dermacoccus]|uniref:Uncharacterized protein n=2 Tax=Dermacoccus TaxID=57495 RepID=A0A417Z1F8_9MICO|nr:hypothetical protein [Dermacoccus abyssi]RHW44069.1 hypothetical protein D1832_13390 [Dermacoccus abyssi]